MYWKEITHNLGTQHIINSQEIINIEQEKEDVAVVVEFALRID